jgi:hypothetical protein
MRQKLFIFSFLISVISYSQNWNVFNKWYRYNYKLDNSALISNVLYADSVKQTGTDTTYVMNNIGVIKGSYLITNKPQFLMKKIIKFATGNVKLQDTTNITIIPNCTLNQMWMFDSNYSLTATCVSISTVNIFNIIDSVKTIIVNNVDSVVLSKHFGIIKFPKLYNQNKYYRLVGIEKAKRYDLFSLYGEKVPNAWDFCNYKINEKYCQMSKTHYIDDQTSSNSLFTCDYKEIVYSNKNVTSTGYDYTVSVYYSSDSNNSSAQCNTLSPSNFTSYAVSMKLDSTNRIENLMYPGFTLGSGLGIHVTKFYRDQSGRFFKYCGRSIQCNDAISSQVGINEPNGYEYSSVNTFQQSNWGYYSLCYGSELGKIYGMTSGFMSGTNFCLNCAGDVGLSEVSAGKETKIYPNPANTEFKFELNDGSRIRIYNSIGGLIKEEVVERRKAIDITNFPNGLYFVEIQTDSFKSSQKLIIQH